jgi:alpha-galactosidase
MTMLDLSTSTLALTLAAAAGEQSSATTFAHHGATSAWINATQSPLFGVRCNGLLLTAQSPGMAIVDAVLVHEDGCTTAHITTEHQHSRLRVIQHLRSFEGAALVESWLTLQNAGADSVVISRADALALQLSWRDAELLHFTSAWGAEFEGIRQPLAETAVLESRAGRSSNGMHPWFALFGGEAGVLSMSAAWSGNWVFRFERANQALALSGGLHDWAFNKPLAPGARFDTPPVILALGASDDLNAVSIDYARIGRRHWYPRNALSAKAPVEWNHWWSYEDKAIDEQSFLANADAAAEMGIEVCTLDAGWFGPTDPKAHWYSYRGDWHLLNATRFPNGLRMLGDHVHAKGMAFGLWCEIEGLGSKAALAEEHPELVALRNGQRLGYVCFGNPATQDWAFDTLSRLVTETGADWIKLDFNLDPGAGCDRADHGHASGDGLYAHYAGYYNTLERLRATFPEVVWENCSSGGLRIDLGILRRTDFTFLSDPDWPEHTLQLFWGASTMLAPDAMLRWTFSDWLGAHPEQTFKPHDPNLRQHQLDYYVRIALLGVFGLSQKLPELPAWVRTRYCEHIALYKSRLRRFVREADLHRLTPQPKRYDGERWAAFQFALPDGGEHLVYVFRLPNSAAQRRVQLCALDPDARYAIEWLSDGAALESTGAALMGDGLLFDTLEERDSALFVVRRV